MRVAAAAAATLILPLVTAPAPAGATPLSPTAAPITTTAAQKLTLSFPPPGKNTSLRTLNTLRVANDGPMTGYSREKFPHWRDASTWGWPVAPSNACNTRQAALYRDGVGLTVNPKTCAISGGKWLDPYTAAWYTNPTTTIQIDHLVPLAEAWRTGASRWDATTRTRFANDPLVLVSVASSANQAKGDKGPEAWRPPNKAAHCLYAQRYVAIKAKYKLTIAAAEKTALAASLNTCPAG